MYAVVTTGGKQYRVEAGSELVIERLAAEAGSSITFDRVLLVGDGEAVTVGSPVVEGASVRGTILGETRGPKLIIFKFKQKATYRRKRGHRQHMTRVRIDEINAAGTKAKADTAKAEKAEAETAKAERPEAKTAKAEKAKAEKPKRTRKPAAKAAAGADATDEAPAKPKRTRKSAASKAEAEE